MKVANNVEDRSMQLPKEKKENVRKVGRQSISKDGLPMQKDRQERGGNKGSKINKDEDNKLPEEKTRENRKAVG